MSNKDDRPKFTQMVTAVLAAKSVADGVVVVKEDTPEPMTTAQAFAWLREKCEAFQIGVDNANGKIKVSIIVSDPKLSGLEQKFVVRSQRTGMRQPYMIHLEDITLVPHKMHAEYVGTASLEYAVEELLNYLPGEKIVSVEPFEETKKPGLWIRLAPDTMTLEEFRKFEQV